MNGHIQFEQALSGLGMINIILHVWIEAQFHTLSYVKKKKKIYFMMKISNYALASKGNHHVVYMNPNYQYY